MRILQDAAQAVQRNVSALLLYAAIFGGAEVVATLVTAAFQPSGEEPLSFSLRLLDVGIFLFVVHAIALAQTLAFSRLGREIDRPLWKVRDDRDALHRFFVMWALISLATNGLMRLANMEYGAGESVSINYLLGLATLIACLVGVPAGAGIMFTGTVSSRTIGEGLAPLFRRPGHTAIVLAVMLSQLILGATFQSLLPVTGEEGPSLVLRLAVVLASAFVQVYLDCLAFAGVWLICMLDRDTIDEIDLDF